MESGSGHSSSLSWEGCWGHPALRPPYSKAELDDCPGSRQEYCGSVSLHHASPSCPRLSSGTYQHPEASPSPSLLPSP